MVLASDARMLLAGDAEVDLHRLSIAPPARRSYGIASTCTALRIREFDAVVADVTTADEALAILRAAERRRPPSRVFCLFTANLLLPPEVRQLIEDNAFAVRWHPLTDQELDRLVQTAGASAHASASGSASCRHIEFPGVANRLESSLLLALVGCSDASRGRSTRAATAECVQAAHAAAAGGEGLRVLEAMANCSAQSNAA